MYAGKKIEEASVFDLFQRPQHPYTQGLMQASPAASGSMTTRLKEIRGQVPALHAMPAGCSFAPRCEWRIDACRTLAPALTESFADHHVACHRQYESSSQTFVTKEGAAS
jgi:oligopeptide/dipeptide ABC transporter ATP-binding protein